jgi:hypothetical protein
MALFKTKEKAAKVAEEHPKKSPQFQGLSIGKILWAGFLVIAIITLLSGYSSYLLYAERIDNNREDQQHAIAKRAADIIATRLDALNQQIEQILKEESVQLALNEQSTTELTTPAALQNRLTEQLPTLMRQLIISADTPPNNQIKPPLSYACLELPSLKRPIMELHRFGTADQHLDIAFPLNNGRSLLLSFKLPMLHQWLKTIDTEQSYIELQQQIAGQEPLSFGQTGNLQLARNRNSFTQAITGSQFQVAVTLPEVEPLSQIERLLYFVNFAVALLLIALTLWATLITVRLVLRKDLRTLGSLMKSSSFSLHHIVPIKLSELKGCAEEIKCHLNIAEEVTGSDATTTVENTVNTPPTPFKSDIIVDVANTEQTTDSPKENK